MNLHWPTAALTILLLLPGSVRGQSTELTHATRTELRARLDSLRTVVADGSLSKRKQQSLSERAQVIERRLEEGDFRAGDVVQVRVLGDSTLTGTYTLSDNAMLQMPGLGGISLEGVLVSEAQRVLRDSLGTYLREPRASIRRLRRVGVLGAVRNPGFYELSADATLADALMKAGGVGQNAALDDLKFQRNGSKVPVGEANLSTLTLENAKLRSGDKIVVPRNRGVLDYAGPILGIAGSVSLILAAF